MKYQGGKSLTSERIRDVIKKHTNNLNGVQHWVEPFVGGNNFAHRIPPEIKKFLSDINPYVVAVYEARMQGWRPPTHVTRDRYEELRQKAKEGITGSLAYMAEVGFVGYCCSYGAKFFGGYASNAQGHNYAKSGTNSLVRKTRRMPNTIVQCCNYKDISVPPNSVVYLDPPYEGVTSYKDTPKFNSDVFWEWAAGVKSKEHNITVFVSEFDAPGNWTEIWSLNRVVNIGDTRRTVTEKVFTLI